MLYRRYFTLNFFLVNAHHSRDHVPLATFTIYSIPHIYNLALFTSQLLLGFTGDLHYFHHLPTNLLWHNNALLKASQSNLQTTF